MLQVIFQRFSQFFIPQTHRLLTVSYGIPQTYHCIPRCKRFHGTTLTSHGSPCYPTDLPPSIRYLTDSPWYPTLSHRLPTAPTDSSRYHAAAIMLRPLLLLLLCRVGEYTAVVTLPFLGLRSALSSLSRSKMILRKPCEAKPSHRVNVKCK